MVGCDSHLALRSNFCVANSISYHQIFRLPQPDGHIKGATPTIFGMAPVLI